MSDLVKAEPRTEDTPLPPATPPDDLPPALTEAEPLDTGKMELERLRREAEAEEAAASGNAPEPASAAPVAAVAPAPAPAPAAEPAAPIMVPKARLDEALTRARNAEAGLLRLEGMVQAMQQAQRTATPAPAAPAQPPAPTLEQLIQIEEAKIEEATARFDTGEITLTECRRIERDAYHKVMSLREQALYEAISARIPQGPQVSMTDQMVLDRRTAELEAANPWVGVIIQGGRIDGLVLMARAELEAEGQPIQGDTPLETLRLREKVAELSGIYGPRWFPNHQIKAPAPAAPQGAQPNQAPAPVARPAAPAAPAANALARVAAHPPNINTMGSTALASNDPTEEEVAAMTTDQIGALPASVRARLQL